MQKAVITEEGRQKISRYGTCMKDLSMREEAIIIQTKQKKIQSKHTKRERLVQSDT